MENALDSNFSLGEVATDFLASLSLIDKEKDQQEVYSFVRWYGWQRPVATLSASEVANYGEQIAPSITDPVKKLQPARSFLTYTHKRGLTRVNLATHLRIKKAPKVTTSEQGLPVSVSLTGQGRAELESELAALKNELHQVVDEVRRAAADKDFRENAPLAAARERQGHLKGRIAEVELTLKSATVAGEKRTASKVNIGDIIVLRNLAYGKEIRYTLVDPREVNPIKGKISIASPMGKALLSHKEGEVIEVAAPAGILRYQIERIEH